MVDTASTMANLGSCVGLDGLIIVVALVVTCGVPIAGFILFTRHITRQRVVTPPEQRLQKLDAMRGVGSITEAEYQDQRRCVLSEI